MAEYETFIIGIQVSWLFKLKLQMYMEIRAWLKIKWSENLESEKWEFGALLWFGKITSCFNELRFTYILGEENQFGTLNEEYEMTIIIDRRYKPASYKK